MEIYKNEAKPLRNKAGKQILDKIASSEQKRAEAFIDMVPPEEGGSQLVLLMLNMNIALINGITLGYNTLIEKLIDYSKIPALSKNLGKHSDIVVYYMLDKITEEIENIFLHREDRPSAQEKDTTPTSLSDQIQESMKKLQNSDNEDLKKGVETIAPLIDLATFFLRRQGDDYSIFDMTTQFKESFLKPWEDWFSFD